MAKSRAVRADVIWAAIGGLLAGYTFWLVAFWIAGDAITMSRWSPVVLIVSVVLAVGAVLWGRRLRHQRNFTLATFAFALPVLPVLLTLIVLADSHL